MCTLPPPPQIFSHQTIQLPQVCLKWNIFAYLEGQEGAPLFGSSHWKRSLSCPHETCLWTLQEWDSEKAVVQRTQKPGLVKWEDRVLQIAWEQAVEGFISHNNQFWTDSNRLVASGTVVTRELYYPCKQPWYTFWLQHFEEAEVLLWNQPHVEHVTGISAGDNKDLC